jgi:microtubule-associated protein-like 6
VHPKRQIAATGQMAAKGQAKCIDLLVWDIDEQKVVAHFN